VPTRTRTTAEPAERPAAVRLPLVVGIILAAWSVLFLPQLFLGRAFDRGDWPIYAPFAEYSGARWHQIHERTFWNPYVFTGLASTASLADSRPQYLPDVALDALGALDRLPIWPPLVLPMLAHLAGMLSAALLVRALWRVGPWSMIWAAVAWGFQPNLTVPFAYGHSAQLVSCGLMPAALLGVHHLFASADSRRAVLASLALALVVGIQTIAGHPQFLYYSLLLCGALALERVRQFGHPRRLLLVVGAVLFALALSAATWWPLAIYAAESIRGGADRGSWAYQSGLFSLGLRDWGAFVWPGAVGSGGDTYWGAMIGTEFPAYCGVTVVLLLALGWWRARGAWDHPAGLFSVVLGLALIFSLGVHLGPAYSVAAHLIPFASWWRVPVAVLIVAQLSAALLSARALEGAVRRPVGSVGKALLLVAALAAIVVGLALASRPLESAYVHLATRVRPALSGALAARAARGARSSLLTQIGILAAGAMLLALMRRGRRGVRVAAPGWVILLAVDLALVTLPLLRSSSGERNSQPPGFSALAQRVAASPGVRAGSLSLDELLRSNDWVRWRVPSVGGSHGVPPRRWSELAGSGYMFLPAVLRALGVGYVSVFGRDSVPPHGFEPVSSAGAAGPALWRVRDPLPRARAVTTLLAPTNDPAVLYAMSSVDSFPERVEFCIDERAAGHYPGSSACDIRWIEDSPDRLKLETHAPDRSFLVVADGYESGWRAEVDALPTPLFRVDHLLRGVIVPAGAHRITMTYRPPGWDAGVASTRSAALAWIVLLAGTFTWPRRRTPGPDEQAQRARVPRTPPTR